FAHRHVVGLALLKARDGLPPDHAQNNPDADPKLQLLVLHVPCFASRYTENSAPSGAHSQSPSALTSDWRQSWASRTFPQVMKLKLRGVAARALCPRRRELRRGRAPGRT